jgi:hypothetical protein
MNGMETNIEIPHLESVGINKSRFFTFIEIARNPDGISVGVLAEKMGETLQATQYTVGVLQKCNLIKTEYYRKVGDTRGRLFCSATPYGIDNVSKEMKSLCELFAEIRNEMVASVEKEE